MWWTFASVALAAWPFGGAVTRIPVPAREFRAVLTDVNGTTVELSRFTMAGEVFVWGDLGAGQISVAFEDVLALTVARAGRDERRVLVVQVRDTQPVRVEVDDDVAWFGRTAWGNYRVETSDVSEIRILAAPPG